MLSEHQIQRLRSVARGKGHPDLGTPNPKLDEMIQAIQAETPSLFWQDWELKQRGFYDEPSGLHRNDYKSYVVANKRSLFGEKK